MLKLFSGRKVWIAVLLVAVLVSSTGVAMASANSEIPILTANGYIASALYPSTGPGASALGIDAYIVDSALYYYLDSEGQPQQMPIGPFNLVTIFEVDLEGEVTVREIYVDNTFICVLFTDAYSGSEVTVTQTTINEQVTKRRHLQEISVELPCKEISISYRVTRRLVDQLEEETLITTIPYETYMRITTDEDTCLSLARVKMTDTHIPGRRCRGFAAPFDLTIYMLV